MKKEFLSLEWFKERIDKSIDKSTVKIIKNLIKEEKKKQILEKSEEKVSQEDINQIKINYVTVPVEKLYKQLMMIGNVLTVVFEDGSILSKSDATKEDFFAIKGANSIDEIFCHIGSAEIVEERRKKEAEIKKMKALLKGADILIKSGEFEEKDGAFFLKGISRSIPQLLVEKFIEIVSDVYEENDEGIITEQLATHEEYQSFKRFFMWCCLNPRAEVANDLYGFLERNSFRITKQGFFVALRNVVTVGNEDKDLIKFISNAYNKIKAVWKKNPAQYMIVKTKTGDYELEKIGPQGILNEKVGILSELYLNLPNMEENRYTDAYTKTFDIRVGQIVNMPMDQCSWSTADCMEAGLHFTSNEIHYVGCGDTSVLILINPMKVVGIGKHKGRCYEYLPIMTVPREEATLILHDGAFDTFQLDEQYAINELEFLQDKAQEGFIIETTKHQFNLPAISLTEIKAIAQSLSSMKAEIEKRVISVD